MLLRAGLEEEGADWEVIVIHHLLKKGILSSLSHPDFSHFALSPWLKHGQVPVCVTVCISYCEDSGLRVTEELWVLGSVQWCLCGRLTAFSVMVPICETVVLLCEGVSV